MHVDRKQAISFAFGMVGIFAVWPLFNQFVPLFLQAGNPLWEEELRRAGREVPSVIGFGLSPALAFFIMTWDNLLNLFVQPWAGMKSDETWTRFGRRKPWIMLGVPVAALGFVLIPLAPTVLAILLSIFITNLGMALFRAPTAAWLGDLFPQEQQSKVRGFVAAIVMIGSVLVLVVGSVLFERVGRAAPFILSSVLLIATSTVALVGVRETPPEASAEAARQKEKPDTGTIYRFHAVFRSLWQTEGHSGIWLVGGILLSFMMIESLTVGISSFAVFTLGLSPGEAARYGALMALSIALSAIPSGLVGTRIGQARSMRIGLMGGFLTAGAGTFFIRTSLSFALTLILLGFFVSLVIVNDLPLLLQLADQQWIGANTGIYFVATQSAAVLGPNLAGFTVQIGGSYRVLFAFVAICALGAWAMLRQVRLEKEIYRHY
jgi:MFS family permease